MKNSNNSHQNSDIVDVVGVTPVPSPVASSETVPSDGEEMAEPGDSMARAQTRRRRNSDNGFTTTAEEFLSSSMGIDEVVADSGSIRCICGNEEDDGFTIQCESCFVWQHASCMGILRNSVPDVYLCDQCRSLTDAEVP